MARREEEGRETNHELSWDRMLSEESLPVAKGFDESRLDLLSSLVGREDAEGGSWDVDEVLRERQRSRTGREKRGQFESSMIDD